MGGVLARGLAAGLTVAVVLGCGAAPGPRTAGDGSGPTGSPIAGPSRSGGTPGAEPSPVAPVLRVGGPAWVAVSVATLWRSPSSPRPVDRPALASPVRIRVWLAAMSVDQRRDLSGRADTQALLGDRVRVLALRAHWARVVVPSQPTPLDARGYPGWVPRRQLTAAPPYDATTVATVTSRLAWLRADDESGDRVLEVGLGTTLPVVATGSGYARVALPNGRVLRLSSVAGAVHDPGEPALAPTRAGVVATARLMLGVDYLWAGRSGFGVDCSGLTSLAYRLHGRTLPRDAAPESTAGRAVDGVLRRGDLLFYATDGVVHHVSMYVGRGRMIHSPHTGSTVQVIATSTPEYAAEYAGARRFLP